MLARFVSFAFLNEKNCSSHLKSLYINHIWWTFSGFINVTLLIRFCFVFAVPHFEKMLYDQGQIANVYLDAFSITKDALYSCVARDILDYLKRDMIGPDGEIFSAEDADSAESEGATRKKEGAFYVWTANEVYSLLPCGSLFTN